MKINEKELRGILIKDVKDRMKKGENIVDYAIEDLEKLFNIDSNIFLYKPDSLNSIINSKEFSWNNLVTIKNKNKLFIFKAQPYVEEEYDDTTKLELVEINLYISKCKKYICDEVIIKYKEYDEIKINDFNKSIIEISTNRKLDTSNDIDNHIIKNLEWDFINNQLKIYPKLNKIYTPIHFKNK